MPVDLSAFSVFCVFVCFFLFCTVAQAAAATPVALYQPISDLTIRQAVSAHLNVTDMRFRTSEPSLDDR